GGFRLGVSVSHGMPILENEMTVKKTLGLPSMKLVAIAGQAGDLAGAAAIYVKESRSGNGESVAVAAACPAAAEKAAALVPFSKGQVAAMSKVDDHRTLPGLVFDGPDGTPRTMSSFAGKTVLLNLWATWCVPCREE